MSRPMLVCCPRCRRHARAAESGCPFCGAKLPSTGAIAPATAVGTLAAVVVAASLQACGTYGPPPAVEPEQPRTPAATTPTPAASDEPGPPNANVPQPEPSSVDPGGVDMYGPPPR